MNATPHKSHHNPKGEHGTMNSYIIGFLLSLLFTAIPYYLVVNKSITGNTLVSTILGIAVLQMAIQVYFFLHLGRGPKPLYNMIFFVGTIGLILVVVLGSVFIMNNLQYSMTPTEVTKKLSQGEGIYQVGGEKTGACEAVYANHKVTIKNGIVSPARTDAKLCDTLTLVNEDNKEREISFGSHPEHENYGGESEVVVRKQYSKTITLNQSGSFIFHDHLEPETTGSFNVSGLSH